MRDADIIKQEQTMQHLYDNMFIDRPTALDNSTCNFEYARRYIRNIGIILLTVGGIGLCKGLLPTKTKEKILDTLESLIPFKIGQGAEALVFKNSPLSVGKITRISKEEMLKRNKIPNTVPAKFVCYIRSGRKRLLAFKQKKVKILNDKTYPKYIDKLDKAMEKKGFKKIESPNVQYRAYTDGNIVIDDISPDNIGVNIWNQPKLIDFTMQSLQEWKQQGF